MQVPEKILECFKLSGVQTPLAGGSGEAVQVGKHVLKRADNPALAEWAAGIWSELRPESYRISAPLQSDHGSFVAHGWTASVFEEGHHSKGRLPVKLAVYRALHADLSGLTPPPMPSNDDPWARAHRIAWQQEAVPNNFPDLISGVLSQIPRSVMDSAQPVHADLSGNVLFHETKLPLVIDFSPFMAPGAYGEAILVADSVAWENSPLVAVALLPETPFYRALLGRAVVFRLGVSAIRGGNAGFEMELNRFRPLLEYLQFIDA